MIELGLNTSIKLNIIIDILDYKQFISILCGMIELGLNTSIKLNIIIDILDY